MAISSVGIGSGLDVETIVKQLVALESKPITALQTKASGINTQISAFSQLKSQISNLQDQVVKLAKPATWLGNTLTSSNSTLVTGTATSSAVQATYDVKVSQMAAGQTIGSGLVTSATELGSGTLTFTMGTWGESGLTANTKDGKDVSFSVNITEADDSLAKIAAKINAEKGDVSATVLKDHTGERLVLQSKTTGVNSAFKVEAEGAGLQQFAYGGTDGKMTRSVEAKDTLATINGIQMASHTNVFEEVAAGVTLTVSQKMADADAPVRITIANDTATAKTALKNLVESYNALSSALTTMTAYDKDTKTAGTLQGDSTAVNLQSAMRRILSGPGVVVVSSAVCLRSDLRSRRMEHSRLTTPSWIRR